MVPAVAGDLVPGFGDPANQSGMACGDPAEREEGGLHARPVEQGEHPVRILLDAARERLPGVAGDHLLEGADLEPVLNVD
jgi:hypothetical protein